MLQGIHILEVKSSPSSPSVLGALYEYRDFLEHIHRREQANTLSSRLVSRLSLLRSQCAVCSTSVDGLVGARYDTARGSNRVRYNPAGGSVTRRPACQFHAKR